MKIAVLAALAGSASAFAPSSGGALAYNVLLPVVLFWWAKWLHENECKVGVAVIIVKKIRYLQLN